MNQYNNLNNVGRQYAANPLGQQQAAQQAAALQSGYQFTAASTPTDQDIEAKLDAIEAKMDELTAEFERALADADLRIPDAENYELVVIAWRDAYSPRSAWATLEDIPVPDGKFFSIGFLVRETADYVTLAGSVGKLGRNDPWSHGEVIHIPAGAIINRKVLTTEEAKQ